MEGFIAWLETKPAYEKYFWADCEKCACGQYYASLGREFSKDLEGDGMANLLNRVAMPPFGVFGSFGDALDRARSFKEDQVFA